MASHFRIVKGLAACCVAAACGSVANAQYFERMFAGDGSERPRGIEVSQSGDFITTGIRQSEGLPPRTYATRHHPDGSLLWAWDYPEANASTGWSTLEALNGDIIVGGSTAAAGPNLQLSMMRLSPLGDVIWVHAFEGSGFQSFDVFSGVRKNVALAEMSDIGFVATATEDRPGFDGLTQAQMIMVNQNGSPIFQKVYNTSITFPPTGMSFNDLRVDTASPNLGVVVTGVVQFEPVPGSGGTTTYEALYARFDLSGNPISAFSYRLQSVPGGPSFDVFGDGIETLPGGDVVIMGRTNMFSPEFENAAVLRINPAGAVVWARTVTGVAPAAAAMSYSDERVIATAGEASFVEGEAGNIALLGMDELGGFEFSRAYSQPSPGQQSLGRDQVWVGGDYPGWAIVGDETAPYSLGSNDMDLLRTDSYARTGCVERDIETRVEFPIVQIRQLTLLQSQREQWTAREITKADLRLQDEPVCENGCTCPGDANGDGVVDFNDQNLVLSLWGTVYAPGTGPGDANCDGVVDFDDINAILSAWGTKCP